jgi:5'-methylthioadenosine phosphorylase
MKQLGVKTIVAMGAVGSLNDSIAPGDLVVVDQFIDKTFKRTNTFFSDYGAVHVEMADPTCARLREKIVEIGKHIDGGHSVHPTGTYVCMEGPSFSTRAESLMHKQWGGDLIGMTAMPEARLAREAQMCYALIGEHLLCGALYKPALKKLFTYALHIIAKHWSATMIAGSHMHQDQIKKFYSKKSLQI